MLRQAPALVPTCWAAGQPGFRTDTLRPCSWALELSVTPGLRGVLGSARCCRMDTPIQSGGGPRREATPTTLDSNPQA